MDKCIADVIFKHGLQISPNGPWQQQLESVQVVDTNRRFVDALHQLAGMHASLPLSRAATVYLIARALDEDRLLLQQVWQIKAPSWIIQGLVAAVCRTYAEGYPEIRLGHDVAMYSIDSLVKALYKQSLPVTVDVIGSQNPWILKCGTIQYETDCPYVAVMFGFVLHALHSMATAAKSLDEDIACAEQVVEKWRTHLPLTASSQQLTVDVMMTVLTDMNRLRTFQCTPYVIVDGYSHVTAAIDILSRACASEQLHIVQRHQSMPTKLLAKADKDAAAIARYTAAQKSDSAQLSLAEISATIDMIYGK